MKLRNHKAREIVGLLRGDLQYVITEKPLEIGESQYYFTTKKQLIKTLKELKETAKRAQQTHLDNNNQEYFWEYKGQECAYDYILTLLGVEDDD